MDLTKSIRCDNFRACLENEKNTNPIEVLCADAMTYEFDGKYDLITMERSTCKCPVKELDLRQRRSVKSMELPWKRNLWMTRMESMRNITK